MEPRGRDKIRGSSRLFEQNRFLVSRDGNSNAGLDKVTESGAVSIVVGKKRRRKKKAEGNPFSVFLPFSRQEQYRERRRFKFHSAKRTFSLCSYKGCGKGERRRWRQSVPSSGIGT